MLNSNHAPPAAHPQGEPAQPPEACPNDTFPVATAGGIFHVRWDNDVRASSNGGLVSLAQFFEATQVFDQWVAECPLSYQSNRAHQPRDILGTFLLSALNGHQRYAHITALRGDTVSPGLLNMKRVVSEDSVRRALKRFDADEAEAWQQSHLKQTVAPLLELPWILDVDTTIKPLYGHQEGAEIGYNPHKPGRPSHALHTFILARARLVLDVEVHPGNEHTSATTHIGLFTWLENLDRTLWPDLLRGDCGFGNETMMAWPEAHGLHYLYKQRMTSNTKALIQEVECRHDWVEAGQGWHGIEATLRLSTWTRERRAVVLRRLRRKRHAREATKTSDEPKQLALEWDVAQETDQRFEYQVLITSLPHDIPAIAQLYRDRADAENVFDELKNDWGWGGFTSRDIASSQIAARMIAQVYNWWSIFVRMASPDSHREARTSRPLLLHSIAKQTTSGGQRTLTITSTHGKARQVAQFFTRLTTTLQRLAANAEQLTSGQAWSRLLRQIFASAYGTVAADTS